MKRIVKLIVIVFISFCIYYFYNSSSEEKIVKEENKVVKKEEIKPKKLYKYVTKEYDHINELVKEEVEVVEKVNYVCEKSNDLIEDEIPKDIFIDGKYYDINGEYVSGFIEEDNDIYYVIDDKKVKGVKLINGVRYYFDFKTGKLIRKNIKSIIDISTWQDNIDFDKLKKSNEVDGVIVRIGFGSEKGEDCTLDDKFERNIKELNRLEIPYGIYFYGYAQNEDTALLEATFVDEMIKKYDFNLSMPIFYDAELKKFKGFNYTKSVYEKVINKFISKMNEMGYESVGLYSNLNMLTKGSLGFKKNYPVWVAEYNYKCDYKDEYIGWQYTNKGKVKGINGYVDMNIFY